MLFLIFGTVMTVGFSFGWFIGQGVTRWLEKDLETRDPVQHLLRKMK